MPLHLNWKTAADSAISLKGDLGASAGPFPCGLPRGIRHSRLCGGVRVIPGLDCNCSVECTRGCDDCMCIAALASANHGAANGALALEHIPRTLALSSSYLRLFHVPFFHAGRVGRAVL